MHVKMAPARCGYVIKTCCLCMCEQGLLRVPMQMGSAMCSVINGACCMCMFKRDHLYVHV